MQAEVACPAPPLPARWLHSPRGDGEALGALLCIGRLQGHLLALAALSMSREQCRPPAPLALPVMAAGNGADMTPSLGCIQSALCASKTASPMPGDT